MKNKIYTPLLDSQTEEIIYYAVKNPDTPRHLREIACSLSVYFDEECLSVWMAEHADEWDQILSFAEAEGYSTLDLDELAKNV